jgi:hypothetical protein
MVINTRGSSAWQRILRVRLALLAIVALLLGTSAIAQEFARF